ncbi:MAG: flavin reductase family protein [Xanthobacter sp.]
MNAHLPRALAFGAEYPLPVTDITASSPNALAYRVAMRKLAGAVSLLTLGEGVERMGVRVTSVSPLGSEPPMLLVVVRRETPVSAHLHQKGAFAINVLRARHEALATRFADAEEADTPGLSTPAAWTRLETGAPVLADALVSFDCDLDEVISRRDHLMVLGRVVATRITEGDVPLLHWAGAYRQVAT